MTAPTPPPPAPPSPPPGAPAQPWAYGVAAPPPPPPPQRNLTAVYILGGVIVGVLVLGALLFVISRLTAGGDPAAAPGSDVVGSEVPVVEESPGVISPIPDQPTPSVEPIPPEDGPTTPTTPTPTPTPTEEQTEEPTGSPAGVPIPLGAGISVTPPEGWTGRALSDASVRLDAPGKAVLVFRENIPPGTTGAALVSLFTAQVLEQELSDVRLGTIDPVTTDVPSIVSAAFATFDAVVITQQGSAPIAGVVYSFVRSDGVATVVQALNPPGAAFPEELNQIIISMLRTM